MYVASSFPQPRPPPHPWLARERCTAVCVRSVTPCAVGVDLCAPVGADGVSYMVAGENAVFFHVSSKKQCADTSSTEFMRLLQDTMRSMKTSFAPLAKKPKKA